MNPSRGPRDISRLNSRLTEPRRAGGTRDRNVTAQLSVTPRCPAGGQRSLLLARRSPGQPPSPVSPGLPGKRLPFGPCRPGKASAGAALHSHLRGSVPAPGLRVPRCPRLCLRATQSRVVRGHPALGDRRLVAVQRLACPWDPESDASRARAPGRAPMAVRCGGGSRQRTVPEVLNGGAGGGGLRPQRYPAPHHMCPTPPGHDEHRPPPERPAQGHAEAAQVGALPPLGLHHRPR